MLRDALLSQPVGENLPLNSVGSDARLFAGATKKNAEARPAACDLGKARSSAADLVLAFGNCDWYWLANFARRNLFGGVGVGVGVAGVPPSALFLSVAEEAFITLCIPYSF